MHRSHCRFRCHIFLLQSGAALGAFKQFKVPHPEWFGPGPGKKKFFCRVTSVIQKRSAGLTGPEPI
jgi:hypothetical protein